jgi:hypothetical protein
MKRTGNAYFDAHHVGFYRHLPKRVRNLKLESQIEAVVTRWAEARNILHLKLAVQFRRGYPDHLYFILGGRPVMIEYKRPGAECSRIQKYILGLLTELGYDVAVAETAEEAIAYLEAKIKEAARRK